jgi:hypothetical protein
MRPAKLLIIVAIALSSGVLTWFLSGPWLVKPMYEAGSIIYVPLTIPSKQIEQQGIGFASDREIDGHIQILKSGLLLDSLIHRFNLAEEYGVDTNLAGAWSSLHSRLASNISIEKTRYNSVSVVVKDHNPERAADMANAIVQLGDGIKEGLLSGNRRDALEYSSLLFESKAIEVASIEKQIDSLEMLGGKAHTVVLDKLKSVYALELQELAGRKNHLEREQKNFETALPTSYVITRAYPASGPSWPPRMLLSLLAIAAVAGVALLSYILKPDA